MERGTKIPPTHIAYFRWTSEFHSDAESHLPRVPSYHKGVDWSVPTGTAVFGILRRNQWPEPDGEVDTVIVSISTMKTADGPDTTI